MRPSWQRSSALLMLLLTLGYLLGCSKVNSDVAPSGPGITKETAAAPGSSAERSTAPHKKAEAILAGGCFWGMQELLREIPGVLDTEVGYTGGNLSKPGYEDVSQGSSGHAEAVRIVYDESKLSYHDLLANWFFRMHDPTTKNRQGNDVGTQYRSAIFVTKPEQRQVAKQVIDELNRSGKFDSPIVTTIETAGPFTAAETYHQDYLQKNPGGYTCHYLRDDWT
jgi:peptide methionine sulfoxide reductase msrA/msrB